MIGGVARRVSSPVLANRGEAAAVAHRLHLTG
jgi:hypothetical protein